MYVEKKNIFVSNKKIQNNTELKNRKFIERAQRLILPDYILKRVIEHFLYLEECS